MADGRNGHGAGVPPVRRLRFDRRLGGGALGALGPVWSGRRFVIGAALGVLLIWAGLYVAHRAWRSRYLARRDFGATRVAPLVDPLARLKPSGIAPAEWRPLVADTHEMLAELTASGSIDWPGLEALRLDVARRVDMATDETALATVARLWCDLDARAGPALAHAPRPERLELALALGPLAREPAEGVAPAEWSRALDDARLMLVDLAGSPRLGESARRRLAREIGPRAARANPKTAAALLEWAWNRADEIDPEVVARHRRP